MTDTICDATVAPPIRPKGWRLLVVALRTRKSASMLGFGFSCGLPFALLIGTLNAWLGDAKIDLATIGVLSWIGLASAFKFLWSPLVDRFKLPGLERIGRRKSWIMLCQVVLALGFAGLVLTDPAQSIGRFAMFAVFAALGWATQDIAVDAWRIDVADETTPVELLSPIYQFGYRVASIVGGAFALFLAARMPWPVVFGLMALLFVLLIGVTLVAPDTPRPTTQADAAVEEATDIGPRTRIVALVVVGLGWAWAIGTLASFMVSMLAPLATGAKHPSAAEFLKYYGPWIVVATVLVPLGVAALINGAQSRANGSGVRLPGAADHLYRALINPLVELTGRLRWGVLIVIGFILTYQMCFNIWSSFAYPFYLDALHYSKDEVAFASKIFGIVMTILGVSLAGILFVRIGRFPTIMIGAILPILGNLIYADLAEGGAGLDLVAHTLRFDALGVDERMVRLLMTICFENISTGIAGACFVAYVSSIVSKRFPAVQYALLSSLTFLIGSLARGVAGEMFDKIGYAAVFRYTALVGLLAILFVALEWLRTRRRETRGTSVAL